MISTVKFIHAFALFSLFPIRIEAKTFRRVFYCLGCDSCSWNQAFFTCRASDIRLQSVGPAVVTEIPLSVRCAYWCQLNEYCVAFNYDYVDGICSFFNSFSYKIYPKKNCMYYESENVPSNSMAKSRKICQSSAAIQNGVALGAWELWNSDGICAQTAEPPNGGNWWMIDAEQLIALDSIEILTDASDTIDRLVNLFIGVTNTSWMVKTPERGNYSICTIFKNKLYPFTSYARTCLPTILSGRYVVVQQAELDPSTPGRFALRGLKAYAYF